MHGPGRGFVFLFINECVIVNHLHNTCTTPYIDNEQPRGTLTLHVSMTKHA